MKKSVITISVILLLLGTFMSAQAALIDPVFFDGNPDCGDLGYNNGFKPQPEPPPEGVYPAPGGGTIEIDYMNSTVDGVFDWSASFNIAAVIVKGGPNANVYDYVAQLGNPVMADEGLESPINPNNQRHFEISHIEFCWDDPTAIDLSSFDVNAGTGAATITWGTGTEIDNAGFNLYRAVSPNGPWVQVNEALITAEGDPVAGAVYTFVDKPGRGNYYYRLEDVDYFGVGTLHEAVMDADLGPTIRAPWFRPSLPWIRPSLAEF